MENIIELITSNPVYLAIAVILAIVIVYGFVKKIIKLALVTGAVFILYVAYLHYSGKNTSEISKTVYKSAEILKEAVSKTGEKVKDSAIKSIEKKVESKLTN
jgi:Ca2+/Na+ antiporter